VFLTPKDAHELLGRNVADIEEYGAQEEARADPNQYGSKLPE
jgi:hypothetical protein